LKEYPRPADDPILGITEALAVRDLFSILVPVIEFLDAFSHVLEEVPAVGVGGMPVHIDGGDGEGNILLGEGRHLIKIGFLGIVIEAAPPVAESIAGQPGRITGQPKESLDGFLI
jgi:hypothetical protein